MRTSRLPLLLIRAFLFAACLAFTDASPAAEMTGAESVNAAGLALHRLTSPKGGNALLSPWSIQNAMAMTFVGAEGETRAEMSAALHLHNGSHADFKKLGAELTAEIPKDAELRTANRLFSSAKFALLPAFTGSIAQNYGGAVEEMDFTVPDKAATRINGWVEKQTNQHIKDLVPANALNSLTRLVLVNATYFNVPWREQFTKELTKDEPFMIGAGMQKTVPMMFKQTRMRYARKPGFQMAALPYSGGRFQFIVIVPDREDGLAAVEKAITPALLTECSVMPLAEVRLSLPRFKMEPPTMNLNESLQNVGVKRAFTERAEFGGMARESPFISDVFHKTFIAVDENGTEAAAATAAVVMTKNGHPHDVPHEVVKADRPFFFAIQHVASGACLFIGRVSDPAPDKPAVKAVSPAPSVPKK